MSTSPSRAIVLGGSPGTFVNNMSQPVHRWYRYSAGFSGQWAKEVISTERDNCRAVVFDPFAGSGTALIAAEQCGVASYGIDAHPFVARITEAKLAYRSSPEDYLARARDILDGARRRRPLLDRYAPLVRRCYSDAALKQLDCLRAEIEATRGDSEPHQLAWLTLVSILRPTSHAGTANWQYLLPSRRKAVTPLPFDAFEATAGIFYDDMCGANGLAGPRARFELGDARSCSAVPDDGVTLVVTSPPYANNYDYADATRLELAFFGEISGWGDLQSHIRTHLIRSCTQHVPDRLVDLHAILSRPELGPIRDDIRQVCERLRAVRTEHGGRKTYHNMVACYFLDLAQVWIALRRVCRSPSNVCFVIGDSAPYGVYVPVMDWLGRLALAAGFHSFTFTKTRDRNVKWKNRKHRVPLCEGQLWVRG